MLKMIGLAASIAMAASGSAQAADLEWNGLKAHASAAPDGGFVLATPQRERRIAAQPMRSDTGSVMFDALFALAQQEMDEDRVEAIRDPAFDEGRPVPCRCFETGERWPYVWTRDVSYAIDLALARLDPERARTSLRFKLSKARGAGAPAGLFVAQDTGSGGSWPISTDRVVWFLAAEDLLDDAAFAEEVWQALQGTLAQDRDYAFDARIGLYRGETSFLDWRQQTYPDWTANDVRFIGESFALSTNVLHYRALRLGQRLARTHADAAAAQRYAGWADALRAAIDARFWRADRGQYMSYIGSAAHPVPFEKYDLLGLSLGIVSDVLPRARAASALAAYPVTAAGSPVVWPQERAQPIYHNRALWPFVSAYSLRAARRIDDAPRIALEIESLMRGSALAGSNMENYEMLSQAAHVEDGRLSGPVVNSPRQLWSVAGYLSMVIEGVFGIEADGTVAPKLPAALLPTLFGDRDRISLDMHGQRWTLLRPRRPAGELLVAGKTVRRGTETLVQLVGR
ncbi:MAG TPA: Six-hairpin glycosidase-like protein, partial [Xanthomonadaceae bacterium]|nr:Six-hairpin glycosidase-like protein [Xanthomonadaceae bacterium]